ncbi:MAG: tetratricopeptide repeat protein [Pirellulales bacterium]
MTAMLAAVIAYGSIASAQQPGTTRQPRSAQPAQAQPTPAEPQLPDITKAGRDLINKVAFAKTKTAGSYRDYSEVIELCQRGLQAGVDMNTAEYAAQLMAWAHNRRGETLLRSGGAKATEAELAKIDQQSLAEFEAAINLDPNCWRAYHNRGVSLAQMRDFDGALKDFDKAIEIFPNHADAWFNRGELKFGQRRYDDAIADYNQALKLNPNDAAAYSSRGHAKWGARQHQSAVEDYNTAIRLDPKSALAYTHRGLAYTEQGLYDRAALDYRKAMELDANLGAALQGAAWLMATCPDERFRDAKKAVEAASKALQVDGWNDFRYIDTLAAAYASAGRFDDAQSTMKEAIKHAPQDKDDILKELSDRMALYEQGKPYRDAARVTLRNSPARR